MTELNQLGGLGGLTERRTAYDVAYTSLREAIMTGVLRGGSKLVQSAVADSLGVSNTPVREALRDLAAAGLVQITDHRGAEVRTISFSEVEGIYKIRVALAPLLISNAVMRLSPTALDELDTILGQLTPGIEPQLFLRRVTQFDVLLGHQAAWPMLEDMLRTLQAMSALYVGTEIGYAEEGLAGEFWSRYQKTAKSWRSKLLEIGREADGVSAGRVAGEMLAATFEDIAQYHARLGASGGANSD